jgi:glucan 1,3-beta-glucosidase
MDQDTGPYITGAWPYIEAALDWANDHGIYVILDLHGAPGSQNGFDNSGQRTGNPIWAISGQKADYSYIQHTLDVLKTVAQLVGDKVAVIELLNELAGFRGQDWGQAAREFWQAGYDAVRAAAGNDVKVMIGDAFLGLDSWYGYMKEAQGVLMDLVRHFGIGILFTFLTLGL